MTPESLWKLVWFVKSVPEGNQSHIEVHIVYVCYIYTHMQKCQCVGDRCGTESGRLATLSLETSKP